MYIMCVYKNPPLAVMSRQSNPSRKESPATDESHCRTEVAKICIWFNILHYVAVFTHPATYMLELAPFKSPAIVAMKSQVCKIQLPRSRRGAFGRRRQLPAMHAQNYVIIILYYYIIILSCYHIIILSYYSIIILLHYYIIIILYYHIILLSY